MKTQMKFLLIIILTGVGSTLSGLEAIKTFGWLLDGLFEGHAGEILLWGNCTIWLALGAFFLAAMSVTMLVESWIPNWVDMAAGRELSSTIQ